MKSITDALAEAKSQGYWGENILGSDFSLDIEIIAAPHNYVAGEDTAVIEVIEGKKPWPRQKPPFPVTVGLFGKPTSVNNVETARQRRSDPFAWGRLVPKHSAPLKVLAP